MRIQNIAHTRYNVIRRTKKENITHPILKALCSNHDITHHTAINYLVPSHPFAASSFNVSSKKYFSTDTASLQERGIFNQDNLLQFKTLHELQTNAAVAFADNPLFGTYVKEEGKDATFDWMSYAEFNEKVNTCRTVLKDLGMSLLLLVVLFKICMNTDS